MKTIIIIVVVVLVIYVFWPKNKKPATPITKSRTSEEMGVLEGDKLPESDRGNERGVPDKYLHPKKGVENSGFFYGKKVCVSGEFNDFPISSELVEDLWNAGAVIVSCADHTCDLLICGDEVSPSKLRTAEEHGMQIMYEEELIEKLKELKQQRDE